MKNKGFTLIELLAVITILGIVMLIGIPAVSDLVNNARFKAFYINERQLEKTAEQYYIENVGELPKRTNESSLLFINDLVSGGYTDPIKDPKDENIECTGYVLTTKTGTKTYSYKSNIKCGDDYITESYYTTPPIIKIKGLYSVDLKINDTYTDAGATAIDAYDGDLTTSITTTNGVNTSVAGIYYVTYNVTNSLNLSTQVKREVTVITPDTTPPVITLVGSSPVNIYQGYTYTDAGATATDNIDGVITSKIVTVNPVNTAIIGAYTVTYNVKDKAGNSATQITRTVNVIALPGPTDFAYTGAVQTYTVPLTGTYKLEVWGAQGGQALRGVCSTTNAPIDPIPSGKGGYTTGTLTLTAGQVIYVYVGEQGKLSTTASWVTNWNGGGQASFSYGSGGYNAATGGGASDIRTTGGAWNDSASLNARIIVAGGGGGSGGCCNNNGGAGGGSTAISGSYSRCSGETQNTNGGAPGTQNSGGAASNGGVIGSFGLGGNSGSTSNCGAGGGGGWYGGGGGGTCNGAGGGGGSSYALTSGSYKPTGYTPTSSYYMTNTQLIIGNASIPAPAGGTETGHTGNGYARITFVP